MLIFLAASIVTAGQTFTCTPTHVWDGDGPIWCAEGPHVRLSGVAAREMDGTCRPGQPCPDASATQARDAAQAAWQLASTRYRAGLGTQLDVLAAQQPLLQLDQQIAALRAQRYVAAIDLDRALGGGIAPRAPSSDAIANEAPTP